MEKSELFSGITGTKKIKNGKQSYAPDCVKIKYLQKKTKKNESAALDLPCREATRGQDPLTLVVPLRPSFLVKRKLCILDKVVIV